MTAQTICQVTEQVGFYTVYRVMPMCAYENKFQLFHLPAGMQ